MTNQAQAATAVDPIPTDWDNWTAWGTPLDRQKTCPVWPPFIYIPSTLNGLQNKKTNWWINYWWGKNEWNFGTYTGPPFDSNFDPRSFFEQSSDGPVKLKAYYDPKWLNPYDGRTHPAWITSEIVLGGVDPAKDFSYGRYGHYAVVAQTDDFSKLDPGVCFGIFTYQYGEANNPDDGSPCDNRHRELDLLETISTAQQGLDGNGQFALQPATNAKPAGTSLKRFTIPQNTRVITAYMYWSDPFSAQTTRFRIYEGDRTIADITGGNFPSPIAEWDLVHGSEWYKNIPKAKNQRVHINLYVPVIATKHIADPNKVHWVTIKRFEYNDKLPSIIDA